MPLDGSETAEKVLPTVTGERLAHQGAIVLMRVIQPLRASLVMPPKFVEQTRQQAREFTQHYLERVAGKLEAEGL
jgi:hypothetical protein